MPNAAKPPPPSSSASRKRADIFNLQIRLCRRSTLCVGPRDAALSLATRLADAFGSQWLVLDDSNYSDTRFSDVMQDTTHRDSPGNFTVVLATTTPQWIDHPRLTGWPLYTNVTILALVETARGFSPVELTRFSAFILHSSVCRGTRRCVYEVSDVSRAVFEETIDALAPTAFGIWASTIDSTEFLGAIE